MTYKEKYEDLDRSKLPEKAIVIIDTMKKDSKGFTDTEALEIVGPKFDQVIAKLKASGYEEAFKSMQKKAPEPKTPVAKAKKIVQQAVKQPKTTSTKAKPTVGAFKKGAVGELAKQISKDGEAWPSALKRAGQMIKEQKSGVQKKATAQYKKLTSLLAKMPELGKGTDVERDSVRKAKPIGKRTAKSGSTYYEYRANRTDVRQGKGYPYLKLGAMLAKGGEIEKIYDKVQMFDEITEKEISAIIKKMNDAKGPKNFDAELKKMVDWVWDNEPRLSKEQNAKGIKSLKNIAFMANGKSRSNSPFGSREEYTLKNFAYFKLRGFYDVSLYGRVEQYVPLYTAYDDEGYGFEYFYYNGKVNVVGAKGMAIKKKSKVDVDFFDSDKKVQDFLNLSKVQFLARYKETKDRYQQMVNAITRNIEGVFMHGGKMAEGGKVLYKYEETDDQDADYIFDESKLEEFLQEHNEYFDTNYKNIEEFNKGEVYRKITKLTHGGKMHGAGQFAKGGNTSHKYKVYYNSYDSEGDSIDSREIIEVYANSFSEAENIARTTLEEGSRDEEFVILDIKKHVNLGNMAKGGMMKKIYEVGIDLGEMGTETIAKFDSEELAEAFLDGYKLADPTSRVFIDTVTSDFLETMNSKGGHMAKGGLTNLKGTSTPKAYPMGEPNINVVV